MTVRREDLGEPLAVGRTAEVYAWPQDPALVLKLFPEDYDTALVAAEELAGAEAHRLGLTPLRSHGQVVVSGRPGLLIDRLQGRSLTAEAERNPLTIRSGSRALARVHARVHAGTTTAIPEIREAAIAALGSAPLAFLTGTQRARAAERIRDLPAGDRLLHLDFHTDNVFTHDGGHVVIDWQTALRGTPAADVAMTRLLLRDAELWPGAPLYKILLAQTVRRVVLATYLAEYRRRTGSTDAEIDAWRLPVVVLRMQLFDIASERDAFRRELLELLSGAR